MARIKLLPLIIDALGVLRMSLSFARVDELRAEHAELMTVADVLEEEGARVIVLGKHRAVEMTGRVRALVADRSEAIEGEFSLLRRAAVMAQRDAGVDLLTVKDERLRVG